MVVLASGVAPAQPGASDGGSEDSQPRGSEGTSLNPERDATPLVEAAARPAENLQDAVSQPFGKQGTRLAAFGGGGAIDGDGSVDLTGFAQLTWFIVDDVELGGELGAWHFQQEGEDAAGGSLAALLRWHFVNEGRLSLFVDGGIGLLGATDEVPDGGTEFNFMPRAGVGATWRPWDGEMRVLMGMRWHHISNARSSGAEDNPSRDGAMLYVGLAMPF